MTNLSYRTAIKRNKLSAPTKWLLDNDKLSMSLLDYGCGKGDDVHHLGELGFYAEGWDPHWHTNAADDQLKREHDVVICNYVLNVLAADERQEVINSLLSLKAKDIYVTVRRDLKDSYTKTKKGTEQWMVHLDYPIVKETSGFCIYQIKGTN